MPTGATNCLLVGFKAYSIGRDSHLALQARVGEDERSQWRKLLPLFSAAVMGLLSCLLDFSSQPQIFVAVGLGELWAGVIVETHNWSN